MRTAAPKVGLWHLYDWQRQLIAAGLPLNVHGPQLFPDYGNFDLRALESLCHLLPGSGRCGLIDGAATVVLKFPDEYAAQVIAVG